MPPDPVPPSLWAHLSIPDSALSSLTDVCALMIQGPLEASLWILLYWGSSPQYRNTVTVTKRNFLISSFWIRCPLLNPLLPLQVGILRRCQPLEVPEGVLLGITKTSTLALNQVPCEENFSSSIETWLLKLFCNCEDCQETQRGGLVLGCRRGFHPEQRPFSSLSLNNYFSLKMF